jgi:DNA replication and repair protein RecF
MISALSLTNFRSYPSHRFILDPRVTVVVGPNATGKTNLLEALFVLATTRSFRAKDLELINHGQDFFRIEAQTEIGEISLGYQNNPAGTTKKASRDGVKQTLSQHLSHLRTVLFEPNDLQLITGTPDRRRRYLDFILTQTDPTYLGTLHRYRRVLQQRNRLLSEWSGQESELFAWNIKLTELATDINTARQNLVEHLNKFLPRLYKDIAGKPEPLELIYISSVENTNYATEFLAKLESNLSRDIGAGFTTFGPHRDDLEIRFKKAATTAVASRGEMRTVVLALKFAELDYIEEHSNRSPILLLDDVFSELDERRRAFLIARLDNHQAVITTTDADIAKNLAGAKTINTKDKK